MKGKPIIKKVSCDDCFYNMGCTCTHELQEICNNYEYWTPKTEPEPMKNIMVVYQCTTKRGDRGVGRCSLKTSAKLPLSIDSIKQIESDIKKDFHYKNVVLLNYFLLGDE